MQLNDYMKLIYHSLESGGMFFSAYQNVCRLFLSTLVRLSILKFKIVFAQLDIIIFFGIQDTFCLAERSG